MSRTVNVRDTSEGLRALLIRLDVGETVLVVDDDGTPLATLVGLQRGSHIERASSHVDWMADWDTLGRQVSAAWSGVPDAVEVIREQRR